MKKVVCTLLIFVFFAPFWISFSLYQLEKNEIRKGIKNDILLHVDRNKLELLKFSIEESKNNLKWEHSDEFEYCENMYDVIEFERSNDSVFYWCLKDNAETDLNKRLSASIYQALNSNAKTSRLFTRIISFFSFVSTLTPTYSIFDELKQTRRYRTVFNSIYLSVSTQPDFPPPKCLNISL